MEKLRKSKLSRIVVNHPTLLTLEKCSLESLVSMIAVVEFRAKQAIQGVGTKIQQTEIAVTKI